MHQLVLASGSSYRRALLAKLDLPFDYASPDIDESPRSNESAADLVTRLSEAKARALAARFPQALIIGSDQVAVLDDQFLGKPGDGERAFAQLQAASGKTVVFLTGLCVLNAATGEARTVVEPFTVRFRSLSDSQIRQYLAREEPYDCAGSFKAEGLGIALFESLSGDDPNALIGLPLIRLVDLLKQEGVEVLGQA